MTGDESEPTPDLAARLDPLLRRRWLLVGVGNELRGDDAIGPRVARRLKAAGLPALEAGPAPENLTGPIRRYAPDVLILCDAAELGEAPGTVRLLGGDDIAIGGTSTHDPSLTMLLEYLQSHHAMEVRLLAIQPATRALGAELTPEVLRAEERLVEAMQPP